MDILSSVKEVVSLEIQALEDLKATLDNSFVEAVQLISESKGKVFLSGMGKSGHIASKIAATLSSVGTPAVFLHPSEALHGDLGRVNTGDTFILLSKAGESDEMIALLPSLKQMNCKTILITANKASTLAKHSDLILYTPIKQEACALNLAPTCSTTSALVVGDALSVALMKVQNFTEQNFALYHPGGRLGKRLLYKVQDLMKQGEENPLVHYNASFDKLLEAISIGRVNAVSVIDDEKNLKGLITGYDVRRAFQMEGDIRQLKASDIMFKSPATISKDTYAIKAYEMMKDSPKPLNLLPVVDNGKAVGMITLQDMIRAGL